MDPTPLYTNTMDLKHSNQDVIEVWNLLFGNYGYFKQSSSLFRSSKEFGQLMKLTKQM